MLGGVTWPLCALVASSVKERQSQQYQVFLRSLYGSDELTSETLPQQCLAHVELSGGIKELFTKIQTVAWWYLSFGFLKTSFHQVFFLILLNCLWCTKLMLEFLVKLLDKTCSFTSTPPPNRFVWKAESQRCGWGRDQVGGESAGAPVCRPTPQMAGWPRLSEAATRSLELPHLSCAIAFPVQSQRAAVTSSQMASPSQTWNLSSN